MGDSLRRLGRYLDKCERRTGVDVRATDVAVTDAGARVDVELALDADGGDTPAAAVTDRDSAIEVDGTLSLALESREPLLPPCPNGVDIELLDVTFAPTAAVVVTARASVATAGDEDADRGAPRSDRDTGVPPFRDRERLAEIYASCETFAEMADVIDMDVSAETVRRYMIRNGVHEPDTYDTGDADDGETGSSETPDPESPSPSPAPAPSPSVRGDATPPLRADGMGLPESVTIDDLVEAVNDAATIREVGRCLGIERMDAFELLTDLDLLEFVMGRLTRDDSRAVGREQILDRLRETAAAR
ncbi:hypothetical protein MBEHAL_1500 [Halarchaeum acidiphilum MH1-52-1]|uniref:Uncharacterized protein n=1 Tax=Halarchaeum acidiphilum MH1-52-1 TaxID=1261545 RepID=U2YUP2_9EURY|nr:hypothetical protein MBEHAL_1500 [Halarchaeum acidiphilum MH1-52-1]